MTEEQEIMRPRGEDVASSIRGWLNDDIKNGPSTRGELGKFFFGVSSGTLGLFATLLKVAVDAPAFDSLTISCFLALFASALIGVHMTIPPVLKITDKGEMDIYKEYDKIVRSTIFFMYFWLGIWGIGFFAGIAKLFSK